MDPQYPLSAQDYLKWFTSLLPAMVLEICSVIVTLHWDLSAKIENLMGLLSYFKPKTFSCFLE